MSNPKSHKYIQAITERDDVESRREAAEFFRELLWALEERESEYQKEIEKAEKHQ